MSPRHAVVAGSRTRSLRTAALLLAVLASLCLGIDHAWAQPDPRQMSGIPRPVTDLPNGSVSVRLIRGALTNNITSHPVELHVGAKTLTVKTDASGRAQFDNLTPGASLKATAEVDGEHLESQEFPAPAQGGIRLLLVASSSGSASAGAGAGGPAAVPGQLIISPNSRIVLEPGDEAIQMYYVLDLVNRASTPIALEGPFMFDMPTGSAGCALLDGSSRQASVNGTRVRVQGPFQPGSTLVQLGCELPTGGATAEITQRFPATLEQLAVIVKKIGATKVTSPQVTSQQETPVEGNLFIAAAGPRVPAGQPIALTLSGLPHQSTAPRWIALSAAAAVLLVGVFAGTRPRGHASAQARRAQLAARRERLFSDLVALEHDRLEQRVDEVRYAHRREGLVRALEDVYAALDRDGGLEPSEFASQA